MRWASPSEIIEAARSRVDPALRGRSISIAADADRPRSFDPRLTAAALSQLLENAAQYSPPGSPIDVEASVAGDGLTIAVRDRGPGIPEADLPHVFERFYRGANVKRTAFGHRDGAGHRQRRPAVERGRIAVENCPGGGVRFTIVVPAEVK
jgi:signal transduction histidine kinase